MDIEMKPLKSGSDDGYGHSSAVPVLTYPKPFVWLLYLICVGLISLILVSISQHYYSQYRLPVDYEPRIRYNGGWPDDHHSVRMTGGVLACACAVILATRQPSTDGFTLTNFMQYTAAGLLLAAHVMDTRLLYYTRDEPECATDNSHWICTYQRYYALVVFDCLSGVLMLGYGFFVTYNLFRMRYYCDEDELNPNYSPELKATTHKLSLATLALTMPVIGLMISQWSANFIYIYGEYRNTPQTNFNEHTPRDLFFVSDNEDFKYGGWPNMNYYLRLAPAIGGLFCTAVLATIHRQHRLVALHRLFSVLCLAFGVVLFVAFAFDAMELDSAVEDVGCNRPKANYMACVYHRYRAVCTLDFFLGFLLVLTCPLTFFVNWRHAKAVEEANKKKEASSSSPTNEPIN